MRVGAFVLGVIICCNVVHFRGVGKPVLAIVLEPGIHLPGSLSHIKLVDIVVPSLGV